MCLDFFPNLLINYVIVWHIKVEEWPKVLSVPNFLLMGVR